VPGDLSISNQRFFRIALSFSMVVMMLGLTGCSSVYYLYQAGRGQMRLLQKAKPIEEVIQDPTTDPSLAALLGKIPEMKIFGEKYGLKPTPNYTEYVKLDQDAVVYVVTVSEALQFKVKLFSFPIVGSFNYIGWFGEKDAREFAAKFAEQGYDIDVRGASAYSTLGWFRDPLLSSMISMQNGKVSAEAYPELVNVIIHESVHATLYIKNQSYFNESLAVFFADILTEKYFREKGLLDSPEWKNYLDRNAYSEKVQARMAKAYADLKLVYDSTRSDEEKRAIKTKYLSDLQAELRFRRPITNATLVQFQTYDPSDHGFKALFEKHHEDVRETLQALMKLKPESFEHPQMEELGDVIGKLN
jgi:predicted aminopeptidase